MNRSATRILTTHAGSLPFLDGSAPATEAELSDAVAAIVAKQRELGLDLINEGEYTKGGDWLSFADDRFTGFDAKLPDGEEPLIAQGRDREEFDAFYRDATERGRCSTPLPGRSARGGTGGCAPARSPTPGMSSCGAKSRRSARATPARTRS